ncbi:MAG: F-type H+-transporting ATPase subunit epsilon [Dehalococcoidia bacterium]|nr:F-type H+-transporting ATPase subunit epsilon [Dehalococcoidia bacterium]
MPTLRLEIVTAERSLFSGDVDTVIAPGIEGELGILPNHVPLLTALTYGELVAKKGNEEFSFAIGGGFLEVRPDKVVVLADVAERAEEIDLERAEIARRRAEERVRLRPADIDLVRAEAALRRALIRVRVAERRRRRHQ